jgi:hypothetical protein
MLHLVKGSFKEGRNKAECRGRSSYLEELLNERLLSSPAEFRSGDERLISLLHLHVLLKEWYLMDWKKSAEMYSAEATGQGGLEKCPVLLGWIIAIWP